MAKINACVFISGKGSNLRKLILNSNNYNFPIKIKLVVCNDKNAKGLKLAQKWSIPCLLLDKNQRLSESKTLVELKAHKIKLILLAGYMRILSPSFVKPWAGRLLNIHPSLLPEFPGAHAHRDVIKAGVSKSGCTVHFVDSGMDTGPIIAQEVVDILPDDDEDSLAEKVKLKEHLLYPMVIDMLSSGKIKSP